jgi:hypothetical protein
MEAIGPESKNRSNPGGGTGIAAAAAAGCGNTGTFCLSVKGEQ